MKRALITGASGFIGGRLVSALLMQGADVSALVRSHEQRKSSGPWQLTNVLSVSGDLSKPPTLKGCCSGIDTVFHLAGYAHAEDATDSRSNDKHWQVTVEGTRALLEEAAQNGVKRFVFASTVKAMGEGGDAQLSESSPATPVSGYGRAKLAAEQLVLDVARKHGLHAVVLRLPLVYGQDSRGNIPRMIASIDAGRFPPLPEVGNHRSMVHVDDVVQALLLAAGRPEANGQVYLVTDGQVYSTRQIELLIRQALGKPAQCWAVPAVVMRFGARVGDVVGRLLGRRVLLDSYVLGKLFGSAWYDDAKIRCELGYQSRHTLADALPQMIARFRVVAADPNSGHAQR